VKNTEKYVFIAISQNPKAMEFSLEKPKSSKRIYMKLMDTDPMFIKNANSNVRKDETIMLKAISKDGELFDFCDEKLQRNEEFQFKAVSSNGSAFRYCKSKSRELLLASVKTDGFSLFYAPQHLKEDKEIILKALESDIKVLKVTPLVDDKEVVMHALNIDRRAFGYLNSLVDDIEIQWMSRGYLKCIVAINFKELKFIFK
jgi:ribosomal protein L24E